MNHLHKHDKALLYKIGFAGFAFANIMIYSLADYFAVQDPIETKLVAFQML
ncbi:MAG: hypothetical protein IPJ43_19170 [Saprospiraceae bacterium]|nr:hypothetical protein [Saprospiraceae bacterium]